MIIDRQKPAGLLSVILAASVGVSTLGCGMPDDDMGDPNNITEETIKKAAEASGQSVEDAKKNAIELLKKQLGQSDK